MRLYRNITEYAAAREIEDFSKERMIERLLSDVANATPLHSRGTDLSNWRNQRQRFIQSDEWKGAWDARAAVTLKALYRKHVTNEKMSWLGERAAERLEALPLDEADKLADELQREEGRSRYSYDDRSQYPLYVGGSLNLSILPENPTASFRRGRGLSLRVTERSLRYAGKRVYNDQRKLVILDYVDVQDGIAFVKWATPSKKNKQPIVLSGAFCEGAFIPGYNECSIRLHVETIRMQARIMETNRALGVKQ